MKLVLLFACAVSLVASASASTSFQFTSASDYEVGANVRWVSIGDWDEDGDMDLAAAEFDSSAVVILFGNGDGTFGFRKRIATGGTPFCATVADLSGDGHADLAVLTGGTALSVLLGNGDGTFQSPRDFSLSENLLSVESGDIDGDLHPDLVFGAAGLSVHVLWGDGHGGFGPDSSFHAGSNPLDVALEDFDQDGNLDVAASVYGHAVCCWHVAVLAGTGTRSLSSVVQYPGGYSPISISAGDANRDDSPDLVAASDQGGLEILLNRGDGTFDPRPGTGADAEQRQTALVDLNNDGSLDLAIDTYHVVVIERGLGNGAFERADTLGGNAGFGMVAAGDLDHDFRTDLVRAGGSVSVFLNRTGSIPTSVATSKRFDLLARPNPARGRMVLDLSMAWDAEISLRIHDVSGKLIRTLASGPMAAGPHHVAWDRRSESGRIIASGVYFCVLQADGERIVRRVELLP